MEDNINDQDGPRSPANEAPIDDDRASQFVRTRNNKDFAPKRGRPPKPKFEIEPATIEQYGRAFVTVSDMAKILGITKDEVERKHKTEIERWRAMTRADLLTWQLEAAKKGDKTMLIWLGKQYLDQKDVLDATSTMDGAFTISVGRNTKVNARVDVAEVTKEVEKVIDTQARVIGAAVVNDETP